METKKSPTLPDGSALPVASPTPSSDWVHEIKQWYFTGSRRSAEVPPSTRFVTSGIIELPPETVAPAVDDQRLK